MLGAVFVAVCLTVGVSDGDTIKARCGDPGAYEEVKVRIGGIDAPEKRQPFGQRAKEAMSDLVYMKSVKLECSKLDRYGRHVCTVSTAADGDVGLAMVRVGLAWWYRDYAREQTAAARGLYERAEAQASGAKRGLWAEADAQAPWEWRRASRATTSE
ncbi:nuclease [Xenophilus aerolatus]|nr:nuclease [Xenophilus aerolatus]